MNRPLISPDLAGISASKCVSRCVDVSAGRASISKPNRRTLGVFVLLVTCCARRPVNHLARQVSVEPKAGTA